MGALFGQGIGDALGIHDEWKPASKIADSGRDRLAYVETRRKNCLFEQGDWSDDTEQALCLIRAYLEGQGHFDHTTFAKHLKEWLAWDTRGAGHNSRQVIGNPAFVYDPIGVSGRWWASSSKDGSTNGAVMRCSVVGTLRPGDLDWTERTAAAQAYTTHFESCCVASSVAVAVAVAALISGMAPKLAFHAAMQRSMRYDPLSPNFMAMSLDDLRLDQAGDLYDGSPLNHTFKSLGAGFWALRRATHTFDFAESIDPILAAGGDVDSNACVAGALVGAFLGVDNIAPQLIHGLKGKSKLIHLTDQIRKWDP